MVNGQPVTGSRQPAAPSTASLPSSLSSPEDLPEETADEDTELPTSSPSATTTLTPSSASSTTSTETDLTEGDADASSPTPISEAEDSTTSSSSTTSDSRTVTRPTTKPSVRPDRPRATTSGTSSSTSALPAGEGKDDGEDDGGGMPIGTWIGIAAGCLGSLVLIMACAAYWRRWKRKQSGGAADPARESFMCKPAPETVPPSPTATCVSTDEKAPRSPDWSDAPLVPPMPLAYQHARSNSLPEPGSGSGPEDIAPYRPSPPPSLSAGSRPSPPPSLSSGSNSSSNYPLPVARPRQSLTPASIVTRGDSHVFSRPVSEVVLGGGSGESDTGSASGAQYYDSRPQDYRNARHNSYASSTQRESLQLDSHRNTMKSFSGSGPQRYI